jgi:hypothetical protein
VLLCLALVQPLTSLCCAWLQHGILLGTWQHQLTADAAGPAVKRHTTALQDVEGFELQVLEGARSLLAKYNVNYVVAECTFGGEPRQRQMLR